MKSFIVAACIVACAFAAEEKAEVVSSEYQQSPNGEYKFSYGTSNNIYGSESAVLKDNGKETANLEVRGESSYKNPEGEIINLKYTADEYGFHPVGDHLPTPPAPQPIPEYIAKAIEWIATHPYTEEKY